MQAMKVENMVKLKEEFDYKSLCRRLETELDRLVAENERQIKAREDNEDDSARSLEEAQQCVFEAESKLASALEVRYCCLPQCCSPADSIHLHLLSMVAVAFQCIFYAVVKAIEHTADSQRCV